MTDPDTIPTPVLGVIGGSGLYEIDGLSDTEWVTVETPFGAPSDDLLTGTLDGQRLVFLPRHGRTHALPPSGLNFRANIDAMKRMGLVKRAKELVAGEFISATRQHLLAIEVLERGRSQASRHCGRLVLLLQSIRVRQIHKNQVHMRPEIKQAGQFINANRFKALDQRCARFGRANQSARGRKPLVEEIHELVEVRLRHR